jgi:hypothetical protein
MKRLALLLLSLAAALPLFAFNKDPEHARIGIVMSRAGEGWGDERFSRQLEERIARELVKRGYHVEQTRSTLEDEAEAKEQRYDLYVEISAASAHHDAVGGVGVGDDHVAAEVSVVHSSASAVVRLYDGASLETMETNEIEKSATGVAPTAISIGGRDGGLWIALPFIRYTRQRALLQSMAEEAASQIAIALRSEPNQ